MTLELAEDALQRRAILYDKGGDRHYDTISAWIKSTRGSDPDASLLYLAAMLEGGEDPRFIARRMVILASEDVGNADPQALVVAVAAAHAVEHVGLPECALNLAQAAVYLALAPKSNASYEAIGRARAWVREHGAPGASRARCAARPTPAPRRSAAARATTTPTPIPEGVSEQELMPEEAAGERFLELTEHGEEREMAERLGADPPRAQALRLAATALADPVAAELTGCAADRAAQLDRLLPLHEAHPPAHVQGLEGHARVLGEVRAAPGAVQQAHRARLARRQVELPEGARSGSDGRARVRSAMRTPRGLTPLRPRRSPSAVTVTSRSPLLATDDVDARGQSGAVADRDVLAERAGRHRAAVRAQPRRTRPPRHRRR